MWTSERIAVGYFAYLALVCWLRPIVTARRLTIVAVSAVMITVNLWLAELGWPFLRASAPVATILIGYYLSGLLFVAPSPAIERWLMAWDRRLLGDPAVAFADWPRLALTYLEIVYMGCFVLIGAGFLILYANGHEAMADRYWTLVVAAELGSFAPLAFIQTRPPWAIERKPVLADPALHDFATQMVQTFTIRANTFPSGHVAGSLAVAIAVGTVMPVAGTVLYVLATTIALATIVGRYHYVIDVVAGALLTFVLWMVTP